MKSLESICSAPSGRLTAAIVLGVCAMAWGDPVDPHSVASNQGVTLTDVVDPANKDSTIGTEHALPEPNVTDPAPSIAGNELFESVLPQPDTTEKPASKRVVRRKPTATAGGVKVAPRRLPWYRSGLGSLAIVMVIVGGAFWAARRWIPAARPLDKGLVEVIGRTNLTPKHQVVVVRIGRRCVVLGVSPDRVNSLSEINDADEVASLLVRSTSRGEKVDDTFGDMLGDESAVFAESTDGGMDASAESTRRTGGKSQPLGDLLNRLRELQRK